MKKIPHIVIVGGGASGLELATRLGDSLGRRNQAHIILIDRERSHIWKPKLHEVAAGSMDFTLHEIDYMAHAHWHHFEYRIGTLQRVDRKTRHVHLAENIDAEGHQLTPAAKVPYDLLVLAIGSRTNDFGVPGVEQHAVQLDTTEQAKRFHQRLVNAYIRANTQPGSLSPGQLHISIVGAGATGVELSAELHNSIRELISYGLSHLDPDQHIHINLIEASPRILPALSEKIAEGALAVLQKFKVNVLTSAQVSEVTPEGVKLADGRMIPSELVVWAAGIRAQRCLQQTDGLEVNRLNQLLVTPTLQTTSDPAIFAMGDCAACPWAGKPEGTLVPPRAQAAHQQAQLLNHSIPRYLNGETLGSYQYKDYGSLVALGERWATGGLMGNISRGTFFVEGYLARFMYNMLYKSHQISTKGVWKTGMEWLAGKIRRNTGPRVKLH
ncbi:MAG TPA: NAD(P)/FAD-dependent oxidoreductase [Thiolinea sp.]|nr:NAD(P)/FAD-dependent oxidoreductase [Thiolinea sp.]